MRVRGWLIGMGALVLSVALFSAPAGAAKIGTPNFTYDDVDFGAGCGAPGPTCVFMQKKLPGAVVRSPFSGKVTKWSLATGGATDAQLVVMRKRKHGRYEAIRASATEEILSFGVYSFETKLRIKRDDYVAIHAEQLAGHDNPDGARLIFNSPLTIGDPQKGTPLPGDQYLYNATIKR
jgi:hypothetical protein